MEDLLLHLTYIEFQSSTCFECVRLQPESVDGEIVTGRKFVGKLEGEEVKKKKGKELGGKVEVKDRREVQEWKNSWKIHNL